MNGARAGSLDASAEERFETLLRHSFEGGMVCRLRVNCDSWRWSSRQRQPLRSSPRGRARLGVVSAWRFVRATGRPTQPWRQDRRLPGKKAR